ncbi:hypothetical protein KJ975_00320 [Myxococcota bacterium]|nr:hypothetical protein [Myxococcota bacterium]
MESSHRSRKVWGGDAILVGLADRVVDSGTRAGNAYDEFSTVEHTSGVVAADRTRGRIARALLAVLEGWSLFEEDPARQGAAERILQAIDPGTLAFLDAPYYEESLTLEKMLTGLAALAADVEIVGVGPVERDLRNLVQYLTTAYEGRDLEHVLEPLTRLRRRSPATPATPVTPTV